MEMNTNIMVTMIIIFFAQMSVEQKPVAMQRARKACSAEDIVEFSIVSFFTFESLSFSPLEISP